MIHHFKLSLTICEPLFPQSTLSFRLDLREVELIHDPRNGQSELDVGDGLSDAATGTDGEWCVGVPGDFDSVFGGEFGEPTFRDE